MKIFLLHNIVASCKRVQCGSWAWGWTWKWVFWLSGIIVTMVSVSAAATIAGPRCLPSVIHTVLIVVTRYAINYVSTTTSS